MYQKNYTKKLYFSIHTLQNTEFQLQNTPLIAMINTIRGVMIFQDILTASSH